MANSDFLTQIRVLSERVKAMPEPIAYIVIDPAFPHAGAADEHDADGRRYLLVNSAILDEMQHRKWGGIDIFSAGAAPLFGIPLYRRQDMHDGWPAEPANPPEGGAS